MNKFLMFLMAVLFVIAMPACSDDGEDTPSGPTEYSVTVEGGTASVNDDVVEAAFEGDEVVLTADEPEEGYLFDGWDVISENVEIVDNKFIMPAEDVEIDAKFRPIDKYLITIEGGTASVNGDVVEAAAEGDEVTLTADEPEEGHRFNGWNVISENVEIIDNKFIMPAESVELKAKFIPEGHNYFDDITDPIFKEYCTRFDTNGDEFLSQAECEVVTQIIVNDMGINSLKGVELFTALRSLLCAENNLTSLNINSNTALVELNCAMNGLTSLNISACTSLGLFSCFNNQIRSLNVSSNTALVYLDCGANMYISDLDVSNNPELKHLNCAINNISSLDVNANTKLTSLICSFNRISSLDLVNNQALSVLSCQGNRLETLDVSVCPALQDLVCGIQNTGNLTLTISPNQTIWWSTQASKPNNENIILAQ